MSDPTNQDPQGNSEDQENLKKSEAGEKIDEATKQGIQQPGGTGGGTSFP